MTPTQTPLDFNTQREVMRAPAQAHSPTSLRAAFEMEPRAGTLRLSVLTFLRECGANGATDEQCQIGLGMNPSTQRPRRIEVVKANMVYNSGQTRKTISGHQATIWLAHPKGDAC